MSVHTDAMEDAYDGSEVIHLDQPRTCQLCLGDGVCPKCHGTGEDTDDEVTRLRQKLDTACHAFRSLGQHGIADELEEVGF